MIRFRFRCFKSLALATGLLSLSACGGPEVPGPAKPHDEQAESAEAGYVAPPALESATRSARGLVLAGSAEPGAEVRLGAPTGEAFLGQADGTGQWSLVVPFAPGVRLFGLSMTGKGRTVQAQGYVMVSQEGQVALLRAGSGAYRLADASRSPRILAVDVDRGGGAVVSGVAMPGAGLGVRVDRASRGNGKADDDGRFFLPLTEELSPGAHDIQVSGEGGEQQITIAISPAQPLKTGPVRADRTPMGWRIDWMTPGGGVQTTLVIGGEAR